MFSWIIFIRPVCKKLLTHCISTLWCEVLRWTNQPFCLCMCKTTWLCWWFMWLTFFLISFYCIWHLSISLLYVIFYSMKNSKWCFIVINGSRQCFYLMLFKCCLDLDICIFLDSFLGITNHNSSAIWLDYFSCVVLCVRL